MLLGSEGGTLFPGFLKYHVSFKKHQSEEGTLFVVIEDAMFSKERGKKGPQKSSIVVGHDVVLLLSFLALVHRSTGPISAVTSGGANSRYVMSDPGISNASRQGLTFDQRTLSIPYASWVSAIG